MLIFGWDFEVDAWSEGEIWSRFVLELVMWPKQVTLVSWTFGNVYHYKDKYVVDPPFLGLNTTFLHCRKRSWMSSFFFMIIKFLLNHKYKTKSILFIGNMAWNTQISSIGDSPNNVHRLWRLWLLMLYELWLNINCSTTL